MTITIYGIKNCDTMKKAFAWLNKQGVGALDVDRVVHDVTSKPHGTIEWE